MRSKYPGEIPSKTAVAEDVYIFCTPNVSALQPIAQKITTSVALYLSFVKRLIQAAPQGLEHEIRERTLAGDDLDRCRHAGAHIQQAL